jgi:hypothetical protein
VRTRSRSPRRPPRLASCSSGVQRTSLRESSPDSSAPWSSPIAKHSIRVNRRETVSNTISPTPSGIPRRLQKSCTTATRRSHRSESRAAQRGCPEISYRSFLHTTPRLRRLCSVRLPSRLDATIPKWRRAKSPPAIPASPRTTDAESRYVRKAYEKLIERVREGGPLVEWDLGHLHVIETAHSNPAGLAR